MTLPTLVALLAAARIDSAPVPAPVAPLARPLPVAARAAPRDTTRPRAVELSDGYARRATVHRWGSWAMVPLLAAQWVLGERMYRQKQDLRTGARTEPIDGGVRAAHRAAAIGMGVVWGVNTVTGAWNLYEARGIPEGRALRTAHGALMLASDAGIVASTIMGVQGRIHRPVAYTAMGVAAASAGMMVVAGRD